MQVHRSVSRFGAAVAAAALLAFGTAVGNTTESGTDGWAIAPFKASYDIDLGIASGESSLELNQLGNGRYEIVSVTRATGIASWFKRGRVYERAVFRFENGEILSESMIRRDTLSAEERSCEVYYRPEDGEADIVFKGERRTIEIPRNTFSPLLMQIALMQDMARDATPSFYNIVDQVGLRKYTVTLGNEDQVKTPLGEFAAIPVDLINEEKQAGTRVFTAPNEEYLAVIVEARKDGDVKATLRIDGRGASVKTKS